MKNLLLAGAILALLAAIVFFASVKPSRAEVLQVDGYGPVTLLPGVLVDPAVQSKKGWDPLPPFLVGGAMVLTPMFLDDERLSWGHSLELSGFSFTWTDLGYRFLPEDLKGLSPVFIGLACLVYRIPELGRGEDDLILRKMSMDGLGIVGRVALEF